MKTSATCNQTRVIPVSYTHLDVYKRQSVSFTLALSFLFPRFGTGAK